MTPDSPPSEPGWFSRALTFVRGVSGNVVELARLVLAGQATPQQNVFFALGALSLVCIATVPVIAYYGKIE